MWSPARGHPWQSQLAPGGGVRPKGENAAEPPGSEQLRPSTAVDGLDLLVRGLDAVSGTPILDVKPFMREFEPVESRQPAWATELMTGYY